MLPFFLSSHCPIAGSQLAGTLPVEVAELRDLQVLDLQQNSLQGTLPPEWGTFVKNGSSLVSIHLDSNILKGKIPLSWCNMNQTSTREMILASNGLTGTLPSCLSEFNSMEDFSIKDNHVVGTIPEELGDLLNLQTIHLAGNMLSGKMPDSVCALESRDLYEASTDCLNVLSHHYMLCACCTKCCDGGEQTCSLIDVRSRG